MAIFRKQGFLAMATVPEIFIDGIGEIALKEGLIRIELLSISGAEPEVRQRLIMTAPAFLHAVQLQQNVVAKLEEAGIVRARRAAVSAPAVAPVSEPVATSAVAASAATAPGGRPKSPNFPDD